MVFREFYQKIDLFLKIPKQTDFESAFHQTSHAYKEKILTFDIYIGFMQGIRVQVRSEYLEGRSQPSKEIYFFKYMVKVTNNTKRPVQLLRRHWITTNADGKTENVW